MRVTTVKELKKILEKLNDNDDLVIETIDENGDAIDLYPMYVDVIEVSEGFNEVRLCQMSQEFFKQNR
jgi:two-component SAPR family response regulator